MKTSLKTLLEIGLAFTLSLFGLTAHANIAPVHYQYRSIDDLISVIQSDAKQFNQSEIPVYHRQITNFKELNIPKSRDKESYEAFFNEVSKATGVDSALLFKIASVESSLNPRARSKHGARGLFQFMPRTWKTYVARYGSKYKIKVSDINDPRANTLIQTEHIKEIVSYLKYTIHKEDIQTYDIYLVHMLGMGGFSRFDQLKARHVVAYRAPKLVRGNKSFFYRNGKALTKHQSKIMISLYLQAQQS